MLRAIHHRALGPGLVRNMLAHGPGFGYCHWGCKVRRLTPRQTKPKRWPSARRRTSCLIFSRAPLTPRTPQAAQRAAPDKTERWPSGRRRTPGTRVDGQPSRGFESLPLRQSRCDFITFADLERLRLPLSSSAGLGERTCVRFNIRRLSAFEATSLFICQLWRMRARTHVCAF